MPLRPTAGQSRRDQSLPPPRTQVLPGDSVSDFSSTGGQQQRPQPRRHGAGGPGSGRGAPNIAPDPEHHRRLQQPRHRRHKTQQPPPPRSFTGSSSPTPTSLPWRQGRDSCPMKPPASREPGDNTGHSSLRRSGMARNTTEAARATPGTNLTHKASTDCITAQHWHMGAASEDARRRAPARTSKQASGAPAALATTLLGRISPTPPSAARTPDGGE